MSWISPYIVRIGSAFALAALLCGAAQPARAQSRPVYLFQNQRIAFSHLERQNGELAVGIDDPGLKALLDDLGATVTWVPGERYVLVTTAEPLVISFAVGETRYDVGPVSEQAPFAPFMRAGVAYLAFDALIHALDLAPKADGNAIVLQPQLAALDVHANARGSRIVAHAGIPLDYRVLSQDASRLVIAFNGVGSTLEPVQRFSAGAVREIDIHTIGSIRNPMTIVTLHLAPDTVVGPAGTDDQRDFTIGFDGEAAAGPPPAALGAAPAASPASAPAPSSAGLVGVTGVRGIAGADGFTVDVDVSGTASYEWHRLQPPDDRMWVDIHNAALQTASQDVNESGPVTALRVHQVAPGTVRIALSLAGYQTLDVEPSASGLTIAVGTALADAGAARAGGGNTGANAAPEIAANAPGAWKFAPRKPGYTAQNPRLIVIDPGHGGSDPGSVHGDLVEKTLTLDIADRLRGILVARGWQVMMTRTTDRDVYAPNDSAIEELQARDDVANENGARIFVSIHVNAFINAGPHGTTTYYSKPMDVPLARDVERAMADENLGTADDGIVKSKLYVTLHAAMPAILIETAFMTNPSDAAKLADPAWREKIARAIADGIGTYAGAPPVADPAAGG